MLLLDINAAVLILGGILALSSLIVAKRPDAQRVIAKLTPWQTVIGLGLIVLGVINFVKLVPHISGQMFAKNLLVVAADLIVIGGGILLGAMLGMNQILEWIPSQQGKQKAYNLIQQLFVFQLLLGVVGLAAAIAHFLYRAGLLKFLTS
ncbi:MAG: hypothetical protein ABI467_07675 [Kofleriaceae bacterium]